MRRPLPAVLALLLAATSTAPADDQVHVAVLGPATWDANVPAGKEVDAIYGDVVLRNEHVVAVIAQPKATRHANMTVRDVGGQLIDLTTPGTPSDQLSAFYVGRRLYPANYWHVEVEGEALEGAIAKGGAWVGAEAAVVVRSPSGSGRPIVETTYRLKPEWRALEITTTYTGAGNASFDVLLEDDVRIDVSNQSIRLSPNGTDDLFWAHDRHWGQAYGVEVEGGRVRSTSGRAYVLKYLVGDSDGSVTLKPGEEHTLVRRLYPAGNLLDVRAHVAQRAGRSLSRAKLIVLDALRRPLPGALVTLKNDDAEYGAAVTDSKGGIEALLPAGRYDLDVTTLGVRAGSFDVEIKEGVDLTHDHAMAFTPGTVTGRIVDGDGQPIPAKVNFRPKEGTTEPDFGPHGGETAVGNLVYTTSGEFSRTLPPGQYDVIVSRGPEYDAVFTELTVPAGETVPLDATLNRVVDTTGWVSADYHSHSSPSGDNTSSQRGRVQNLVCEHVEFAPCTEHNRISTYEPHIAALGIARYLRSVSGMELTGQPLPLNHQNAFPLIMKPRTQDGGGPVTDGDVETQFERLALWDDRSEKYVQQNHPDVGWLFYDKNGDGEPDEGHERVLPHVDAMEIHPIYQVIGMGPVEQRDGKPFGNNRIFNWLQMLNQGHRIVGVTQTDAHYNFHGSGGVRIWVESSTDEPGEIDVDELRINSEKGRVLMSNGPFLTMELRPAGQADAKPARYFDDVTAKDGKVEVHVKVQCPNWIEVDHVYLLVNGQRTKAFDFGPDAIGHGVVRFDETVELTLEKDAHVVAVAVGESATLGPTMGPVWGKHRPAAITNPVFVDVDGGGFQPSKDTLGAPLPVKHGTRK
jgi:hypothetical protein